MNISMDFEKGELLPAFIPTNLRLSEVEKSASGRLANGYVVKDNRIAMLPYSEEEYIVNSLASSTESINPYDNFTYAGSLVTSGPTGESACVTTTGAYPLVLGTSNTARMTILGNGNVGIGSTSPAYKLDVAGGDVNFSSSTVLRFGTVAVLNTSSSPNDIYANIRVLRNESTVNTDGMYIGYGNGGTTGGHLRFYANSTTERMRRRK